MMPPLLFALPGARQWEAALAASWPCEPGMLDVHRFPDGECCPRFLADVAGRHVVLLVAASGPVQGPDPRLFEAWLTASVARELGAASVGLVVPYLPYMRQDASFAPGQGVTARHVGALLSSCADWLVTADPHLHRYHSLSQPYRIATAAAPAAPAIAQWLVANVERPLVVGPDGESAQWARHVAQLAGCPAVVLHKERSGDRDVAVTLRGDGWAGMAGRTPVLVDDIASSGRTMAAAIGLLRGAGLPPPVCVVVHALFAGDALEVLRAAGAARIASCNTVPHASNAIDLMPALAAAARQLAGRAVPTAQVKPGQEEPIS